MAKKKVCTERAEFGEILCGVFSFLFLGYWWRLKKRDVVFIYEFWKSWWGRVKSVN